MKKGEKERWKMSNARKKYEKQSKERMTNEVIDERTMGCTCIKEMKKERNKGMKE